MNKDLELILRALSWASSCENLYKGDVDLNQHLSQFFKAADTQAAVLIPLIKREGEYHVILTQRPQSMREHGGQISFPGGKADESDQDIIHTALREADEEIGLKEDQVEILGTLPHYNTRTGYHVTPVVGLVDEDFVADINPDEVDHLVEVPLSHFLEPDNCVIETYEYGEYAAQYYNFDHEGHKIWGATAGMIVGFRNAVLRSGTPPAQDFKCICK